MYEYINQTVSIYTYIVYKSKIGNFRNVLFFILYTLLQTALPQESLHYSKQRVGVDASRVQLMLSRLAKRFDECM